MVSVSHTAHNIEITAESLQEDLARLEIQKQALERELAAVVAHLGSVQRALEALEALMHGGAQPQAADAAAAVSPKRRRPSAPVPPQEGAPSSESADDATITRGVQKQQPAVSRRGPRDSASPAGANAVSRTPRPHTNDDGDDDKKYGKLTEQILEYFEGAGDADVRARDVAAALGRDKDSGSINAVRSTLDRLVGTSRIRRTGRGLYAKLA
ncbi:hypothetical protein [Streptomyces sp. V4I2]|uniref:hypothetical protein n=1 Tax=Streptomyces sp. V4I2 TaxID=3042280 RepID=UPI002788B7A2|nr:hypothetical protein [Streptomyces sp. V4I2]MDQ1051366.1 hypothetical protein [Streptomyces sp. V4I2]